MFFPAGLAAVLSVLQELGAGKCRVRFQFQVKLCSTHTFSSSGTVWGLSWTSVGVKVIQGWEDEEQGKDKEKPGKISKC